MTTETEQSRSTQSRTVQNVARNLGRAASQETTMNASMTSDKQLTRITHEIKAHHERADAADEEAERLKSAQAGSGKRHHDRIEREHRNARREAAVHRFAANERAAELTSHDLTRLARLSNELETEYLPEAVQALTQAVVDLKAAAEALDAADADYRRYKAAAPNLVTMDRPSHALLGLWNRLTFRPIDGATDTRPQSLADLIDALHASDYNHLLEQHDLTHDGTRPPQPRP